MSGLTQYKIREGKGDDPEHFLSTLSTTLLLRTEIVIGTAGTATGYIEYVGFAPSYGLLTQPIWKIIKLVYDASGNVLRVLHANGETKFNKVFDSGASEYASYTFSTS